MHRKKPCNICGGRLFEVKETLIQKNKEGKIIYDAQYEERCVNCGNLLYGWVKPFTESPTIN